MLCLGYLTANYNMGIEPFRCQSSETEEAIPFLVGPHPEPVSQKQVQAILKAL